MTSGAQAARGVTTAPDVTAFARDIDWGSFPDLPDEGIALSESPGVVPGDSIRLVLESAPNIT